MRILAQLSVLQCWERLENTLIAEMRRRGDPGTGGQHCYVGDPVVSRFLCPVAHLSMRQGLLPFKACGGSYSTAFHAFMCAGVRQAYSRG